MNSETKHSGPVDVLAVLASRDEFRQVTRQALANYAERCRSVAAQPALFEVDRKRADAHRVAAENAESALRSISNPSDYEAGAIVARAIEALRDAERWISEMRCDDLETHPRLKVLRAALANVGSAP